MVAQNAVIFILNGKFAIDGDELTPNYDALNDKEAAFHKFCEGFKEIHGIEVLIEKGDIDCLKMVFREKIWEHFLRSALFYVYDEENMTKVGTLMLDTWRFLRENFLKLRSEFDN
jgi:hypothetical protein